MIFDMLVLFSACLVWELLFIVSPCKGFFALVIVPARLARPCSEGTRSTNIWKSGEFRDPDRVPYNMAPAIEKSQSATYFRKPMTIFGRMQACDLRHDVNDPAPDSYGILESSRYRRVPRVQGKESSSTVSETSKELPIRGRNFPENSFVRSRMHIMGGTHKGRALLAPSSDVYIRPMMSRVKAALFSTLSHFNCIKGSKFLDLFCGVGSVGIEALSRGAVSTIFIDKSPRCSEVTRMNLQTCKFSSTENPVFCADAFDVLSNPSCIPNGLSQVDVLTATPPYEEISYQELLNVISRSLVLRTGGIAVVEYPVELGTLPFAPCGGALLGLRNRRYGRTVIAMYAKSPPESDAVRSLSPVEMEYRPDEFSKGPLSH